MTLPTKFANAEEKLFVEAFSERADLIRQLQERQMLEGPRYARVMAAAQRRAALEDRHV